MSAGKGRLPQFEAKQAVFAALLEEGIAALHIDARREGVDVPQHLQGRPWLVLNYSYRFQIDDFRFDDSTVFASLSFSGARFPCRVPWAAVFAISDARRERMRVWAPDMPLELRAALIADSDEEEPGGEPFVSPEPTGGLRVVDGGAETLTPRRTGHLTRVK